MKVKFKDLNAVDVKIAQVDLSEHPSHMALFDLSEHPSHMALFADGVQLHGLAYESESGPSSVCVSDSDYGVEVLNLNRVDAPSVGSCVELRVGRYAIVVHEARLAELAEMLACMARRAK
jgi:hypothetical protein